MKDIIKFIIRILVITLSYIIILGSEFIVVLKWINYIGSVVKSGNMWFECFGLLSFIILAIILDYWFSTKILNKVEKEVYDSYFKE